MVSHLEKKLFGTSGIRGLVNVKITPEFSAKLGLAAAAFYGEGSTLLVGRDHRPHAQIVEMSLISGLLAGGVNVLETGIAPTPAILWAISEFDADGAIVCTGSHTPSEIVGILFFKRDTAELNKTEEATFEDIFFGKKYRRVPWNVVGSFEYIDVEDIYLERVLSIVPRLSMDELTVVVDPGSGSAAGILKEILENIGLEVVAINDVPDPRFPRRDPFPRPQNLEKLGRLVKGMDAILGVATDGDGDRAIFAGENGEVYWGDISSALFAMDGVKYRGINRVVVTVNTSSVVEMVTRDLGGSVYYCDVGPPAIVEKMKEVGAKLGLEESGKYIWSDAIYYGDAAVATIRMLEFLTREGRSMSEIINELPKRVLTKIAIDCPDEIKKGVSERVYSDLMKSEMGAFRQIVRIHNGFKVIYDDDSWILFRPSGTEPKYRIHAEADSDEKSRKLLDFGKELVINAIRALTT